MLQCKLQRRLQKLCYKYLRDGGCYYKNTTGQFHTISIAFLVQLSSYLHLAETDTNLEYTNRDQNAAVRRLISSMQELVLYTEMCRMS